LTLLGSAAAKDHETEFSTALLEAEDFEQFGKEAIKIARVKTARRISENLCDSGAAGFRG